MTLTVYRSFVLSGDSKIICHQHRFCASGADGSNSTFVLFRTSVLADEKNFEQWHFNQHFYINLAWVRADVFQSPHLHKAFFVGGNRKKNYRIKTDQ